LDLESMEGVSSELGPLEYLSGLLDRPMDVIINWFILIIIFVFDPLAVALVIAFNNAVLVDRGIVDKKKVVAKRELYGEDDDSDDSITFPSDEEEWVNDESKDDTDDEWDEDHALDMVMNDMVSDMDVEDFLSEDELNEYYTIKSNDREKFLEDEIEESEEWEDDVEPNEVLNEAVNSYKDFINPLDNLKKDTSRRGIDIDGDGTIDGYDNNGDGLIDEPAPSSSQRAKYVMNEKPFYARPNFNWGDRSKWINNQNAVNYWLTFIKNESDSSYPTDFNSKTY
jgi:hypothetical protein